MSDGSQILSLPKEIFETRNSAERSKVENPELAEWGDLPNDVRTHYIESEDKEKVFIANLLLFKNSQNIDNHNKSASNIQSI